MIASGLLLAKRRKPLAVLAEMVSIQP